MVHTVDKMGDAQRGDVAFEYEVLGHGRDDEGRRNMMRVVTGNKWYVEKHYNFPTCLGTVTCCGDHWHRTADGMAECDVKTGRAPLATSSA